MTNVTTKNENRSPELVRAGLNKLRIPPPRLFTEQCFDRERVDDWIGLSRAAKKAPRASAGPFFETSDDAVVLASLQ